MSQSPLVNAVYPQIAEAYRRFGLNPSGQRDGEGMSEGTAANHHAVTTSFDSQLQANPGAYNRGNRRYEMSVQDYPPFSTNESAPKSDKPPQPSRIPALQIIHGGLSAKGRLIFNARKAIEDTEKTKSIYVKGLLDFIHENELYIKENPDDAKEMLPIVENSKSEMLETIAKFDSSIEDFKKSYCTKYNLSYCDI